MYSFVNCIQRYVYMTWWVYFCRPEAIGVVTGCIFLITMFLFIPIPFTNHILKIENFPHDKVRLY